MNSLFEAIGYIILFVAALIIILVLDAIDYIGTLDPSAELVITLIIVLFIGIKIGKRKALK